MCKFRDYVSTKYVGSLTGNDKCQVCQKKLIENNRDVKVKRDIRVKVYEIKRSLTSPEEILIICEDCNNGDIIK